MKRTLIVAAAVLAAVLPVATPAQAAPLVDCDNGSYSDLVPPHHTHWVMGQRFYPGGSVIFDTTYRFWLHENPAYSPPLFVSATRAKCGPLGQSVQALTPAWQTGTHLCTASGDHQDPLNSAIHHLLVGQRVNRVNLATQITANFRFWIREERSATGARYYLDSSVAMC